MTATTDHLATVRAALAVNPSHLIAPSIAAVCDELERARHEGARLRRLLTIDPGTFRDCRDCGGAGGFDFPRASVNGGVTRLDCPTCVRRVMRAELDGLTAELAAANKLIGGIGDALGDAGEPGRSIASEVARVVAVLAAARAVPADVEAAIDRLNYAAISLGATRSLADIEVVRAKERDAARNKLRATIARAIESGALSALDEFRALLVAPRAAGVPCPACKVAAPPATVGGLLATDNPHPDGCHTSDPTALRDCTSDGHHECVSCARFDAAGRDARGDDPIGGRLVPADVEAAVRAQIGGGS